MMLPGGVWQQGRLHRDVGFRPVDGHLELALAEAASGARDIPGRVSGALQAALTEVGSLVPDREVVDALSVGDRQFLVSRLTRHLGFECVWLSATCRHCQSQFDFPLDYGEIPVKPAGEGYPFARVMLSMGQVPVRVPTGADQRAILSCSDERQARRELARRCIVGKSAALTDDDVTSIETVLEELAPELATRVSAQCPQCGGDNVLAIDPYYCLGRVGNELFTEIHRLAGYYHWSETEILSLPLWRRKKYLSLIDRAREVTA
jgi:hypothetical protein